MREHVSVNPSIHGCVSGGAEDKIIAVKMRLIPK
jgi:hypothetical protein